MAAKKDSQAALSDACITIIAALRSKIPASTKIVIEGKTYKVADLIAVFQSLVDTTTALTAAKAATTTAVTNRKAAKGTYTSVLKGLKAVVRNTFGSHSPTTQAFGFEPKVHAPSVKTKAAAIDKSAATREARGTRGSKQKAAITAATVAAAEVNAAPTPAAAESTGSTAGTAGNGSGNGTAH